MRAVHALQHTDHQPEIWVQVITISENGFFLCYQVLFVYVFENIVHLYLDMYMYFIYRLYRYVYKDSYSI